MNTTKHDDLKRRLAEAVSRGDTAMATHLRMALARQGSILGVRAERRTDTRKEA